MLDLRAQRILLTGGAGFLGRAVRRALVARGVSETSVFAPTRGECDLTRQEPVERMIAGSFAGSGPTLVLHAAGFVGGLGANRKWPARFFYDNLIMALNLVEGCRVRGLVEQGLKFVQVGTMCSYPADAACPYREEALWRGLPEAEIASYGVGKLAVLQMLEAYRLEHGLRSAYVIPTGFYGPGDNTNPANSHVIGALIKKYVDGVRLGQTEVVNWGTGAPVRDFIHVDDAADGLLRAAEVIDAPMPINLTGGVEISIRELARAIAQHAGFAGTTRWDATAGDGQMRRGLCGERAKSLMGWSARVALEDGLRESVRWYASNPS